MITHIRIDGFKAFRNFEMSFTPLTVIAGANASGKSNLFDALQLLSDLSHKELKDSFRKQRGAALELFTQFEDNKYAQEMFFEVDMLVDKNVKDSWGGEAMLKYTRLRYQLKIARRKNGNDIDKLVIVHESLDPIRPQKDEWVKNNLPKSTADNWRPKVKSGRRSKPYIYTEKRNGIPTIKLPQDGRQGGKETPANIVLRTVLSGIDNIDFPHVFAAREEIKKWKFLQLNPEDLRAPTQKQIGMTDIITQSGKNLAAALFRIAQEDKYYLKEISRQMNKLLPNIVEVEIFDDKIHSQYIIKVTNNDGKIYSSRVLSEGTLRILTLCIFLFDNEHKGLLCYEEPENGIHPFRVKSLTELLVELCIDFNDEDALLRQILVNTHSPVLVGELINWKSDNRVSVWFSQLNTLLTDFDGEKVKINITKMLPVLKEDSFKNHLSLFPELTESEKKMTLTNVKKYLQTTELNK